MPPVIAFLSLLTTAFSAALALMLYLRKLHKDYPVFFFYCLYDAVGSVLLNLAPLFQVKNSALQTAAVGLTVIRWPIEFLIVIELTDRILKDHPGLARIGRYVVTGAFALAILGIVLTFQLDAAAHKSLGHRLALLYQADRGVSGCLLFFLALIACFLWYFPVRLSSNTKAYYWGYGAFFLAKAAAVLALNLGGESFRTGTGFTMLGVEAAVQVFWLFALRAPGGSVDPVFPRSWTAGEQEKVLATLSAFEHTISRSQGD